MPTYISTKLGKAELVRRYGSDGKPIVKDGLKVLARAIKRKTAKDYQVVAGIDGGTGSGKSTLAINLALEIDHKWDIDRFYVYELSDLSRAISYIKRTRPNNPVILFDEGSIIMNSKNALCKEDKGIVNLFDTMRYLHITSLICCPNLMRLNKTILFDHMDFRLMCPDHAPIKGYDPRGFVHVHGHWSATWSDKQSWPFIYTTIYPKMPKSMALRYDRLKTIANGKILDKILCDE